MTTTEPFLTVVQDGDRDKWIGDLTIRTAGAQAQIEILAWFKDKIIENVNASLHGSKCAKCECGNRNRHNVCFIVLSS